MGSLLSQHQHKEHSEAVTHLNLTLGLFESTGFGDPADNVFFICLAASSPSYPATPLWKLPQRFLTFYFTDCDGVVM